MAITVRVLLKSIIGIFAMIGGASSSLALQDRSEVLTLSDLIRRLRRSAALRGRFADNPRAVLLEYGIDPTPYNLPDQISTAQMDRLLARFAQAPTPTQPPTSPSSPPEPPAVVYGPPPGPSSSPRPPAPVYGPPPGPPPRPQPSPQPPAPVYGPPPGRQK